MLQDILIYGSDPSKTWLLKLDSKNIIAQARGYTYFVPLCYAGEASDTDFSN